MSFAPAVVKGRIEQFDGLRACAFTCVFAFHSFKLRPGWLGVDLFFVLSGFLITQNLLSLRDRATTTSAMATFFYRRLLRILPPYYLTVGLMMLVDPTLVHDALWYLTFTSNVHDTVYPGVGGPALTLWSIAVEEQFYLAWPCLVLLAPRRWLVPAFLLVAAAAPIFRALFSSVGPDAVYRLTPSRMDLLALGALLGYFDARDPAWLGRHRRAAALAAVVGGAVYVGWRLVVHDFSQSYSSLPFDIFGYGSAALGCAGLLAWVRTQNEGVVYAALTHPVLRHIGMVSYMAYLVHVVVWDAVHRIGLPGAAAVALAYGITILVATASWYAMEAPLQQHRDFVVVRPRVEPGS